jgi:hypothetical protein
MKIQELRVIAKEKGIGTAKMTKADMIRAIQRAEGNFDCFGKAKDGSCDQAGCAWMEDCLP